VESGRPRRLWQSVGELAATHVREHPGSAASTGDCCRVHRYTDEDLLAMVEANVDERIAEYQETLRTNPKNSAGGSGYQVCCFMVERMNRAKSKLKTGWIISLGSANASGRFMRR
jgi:hypothetical protein